MEAVNQYRCMLVAEQTMDYTSGDRVRNSADVMKIALNAGLHERSEEYVFMLCLDSRGNPIGIHEISHGCVNSSLVHPREVFKRAVLNNAASIILMHNHPSGDVTPSPDDEECTKRIHEAGEIMGIRLVDHIIVAPNRTYYSMSSQLQEQIRLRQNTEPQM